MANRYVYSGAAGGGTGADWANAHTTLTAAITAASAGDIYYVAHDHAESTAGAVTLTFKGTITTPDRVLCVNRAGTVPPVAADLRTTATVTTTGANAITVRGFVYGYGIIFNCGTGASAASFNFANTAAANETWEACAFNLVTSASSSLINCGGLSSGVSTRINLVNSTVSFGATGQLIQLNGILQISGKPGSVFVTGATIPTTLFGPGVSGSNLFISGMDLSASASGKTLFGASMAVGQPVLTQNCKLDSAVTISATPGSTADGGVDLIGCHSTTNAARNERYRYTGTLTTETTIVRTSGASDGTTSYSWKVVTTANAKRDFPFECFEGVLWNTTLSAQTLTIPIITDNVTLTDAEIWLEVEYLGSAATPVTTLITDANATVLTTAANQTSSSSTWTTTGLTTPLKQELAVTFTPAMVGPIRWRVKVAKASTTVYIDPKPVIS